MSSHRFHIAVCDDCTADSEYLRSLLQTWADERAVGIATELFPSAESFLFRYAEDKQWDILLLDIEMGKMDGVSLAKEIRRSNGSVQIIFVTGYSDYIAEGYEVAALHYLVKPIMSEKLFSVLDRALERQRQDERILTFTAGGEMIRLPFRAIRYAEVHLNYVTLHADEDYTMKRTLSELESTLDERFFRVGRSLLLNLSYVRKTTKTQVYLSEGTVLPLPRGAYESLNRAIIQYS